jgi:hypothetical protein
LFANIIHAAWRARKHTLQRREPDHEAGNHEEELLIPSQICEPDPSTLSPMSTMSLRPPLSRPLPELKPAPTPPPFRLLAAHFLLVMASLTLGSIGVVVIAPRLAVGDFLSPHVLATVHLFTLGVLLAAISGVMHQFYPMALGWALRSKRVAAAGVTLLILGVAAVVTGFWFWVPAILAAGWVLIFSAIGCVAWNLLPARRRVPGAQLVGGFVSAGHIALGFALLLAAGRIGEFLHWWTIDRLGTIAAHYHLAALGFGTLTAVGVGSRMIPMFLVSHGAPTKPVPWIGVTIGLGLACFMVGAPFHLQALQWLGASFMFAGVLLHLTVARWYFARRLKRTADPAMDFVRTAFINLALAALVGVGLLLTPGFHAGLWVVYALLGILGWLMMLIMGILQKLVPHLGRMHLFGRAGKPIPDVSQLILAPVATLALVAAESGLILLALGAALTNPPVARLGSMLWLAGVLMVIGQFGRIVWMAKMPTGRLIGGRTARESRDS